MIKISVVIPVYNSEKSLRHCIESLLVQTEKSCEFIFVNDGSKDSSREILESFPKSDERIIIINQENQGVSAARNNGIRRATGNYIAFVDADDFVEPDTFEKLLTAASSYRTEIVVANYIEEFKGVKRKVVLPFPNDVAIDKKSIAIEIIPAFINGESLNQCWNKLYKKDLFESQDLEFPRGMPIGEDGIFNLKAFNHANSIVFVDYAGYHYLEADDSATRNIAKHDYFKRALEMYEFDYANYAKALDSNEVQKLKAVKFIFHVLAIVGIYLGEKQNSSIFSRMAYVRKVIRDKAVSDAIALSGEEAERKMTRYQKFLLNCIRNKNFVKLMIGVVYSNFRNTNS